MRVYKFNYNEFPNTSTEEHLTISFARKSEFDSPKDFFRDSECEHSGTYPDSLCSTPFAEFSYRRTVIEYLALFTPDIEIPENGTVVFEITNEPCDLEVIIETESLYICYWWWTSA